MFRAQFVCLLYCAFYAYTILAETSCILPTLVKCDNRRCISYLFVCDGVDDCGDGSDERNCTNFSFNFNHKRNCTKDEYRCNNDDCIPLDKFCDRQADCQDKSDEYENCTKNKTCDEFRCDDGYCTRKGWHCDGVKDCADGSDEKDCNNRTIHSDECNSQNGSYLCSNKRCISLEMVCNGMDDCGDWSDENSDGCKRGYEACKRSNRCNHFCKWLPTGATVCTCRPGYNLTQDRICVEPSCMEPGYFRCETGKCLSYLFVCDGEDDCDDNSDEINCTDFKFTVPPINCSENEYKCRDGNCIPSVNFCDGEIDCPDESDEYTDCEKDMKCDGFRCNDGGCVKHNDRCNGINDCLDDSDEKNCIDIVEPNDTCVGNDLYLCKNYACIAFDRVCNKFDDCGDRSDETSDACEKALISKMQRLVKKKKHLENSGIAGWVFRRFRMESMEIRMDPIGNVSIEKHTGNETILDTTNVEYGNRSDEENDFAENFVEN